MLCDWGSTATMPGKHLFFRQQHGPPFCPPCRQFQGERFLTVFLLVHQTDSFVFFKNFNQIVCCFLPVLHCNLGNLFLTPEPLGFTTRFLFHQFWRKTTKQGYKSPPLTAQWDTIIFDRQHLQTPSRSKHDSEEITSV